MRCYKCGSVLSETEYCNSCGADVKIYKKIIRMSNSMYNAGLEKAKNKELSGAADMLRRSIMMDKNNIQARNLLGLVYYEMGEFVDALSQWVISKNIKPDKNLADDYIKDVQSNPAKLESMNMSIKKYNKALDYAKEGSDDLAIIQLKKVLNLNPKFVKGYQLLGLLYIRKEEYLKARKYLKKTLLIDYNNTLSTKYLREIEEKLAGMEVSKKPVEEEKEKKALSGNDVIIPETGYKDVNYGLMQFIVMIVGVIIGACMVYFLVTPAKENRAIAEYKESANAYSEDVDKLNISISELETQLKKLGEEKESMAGELAIAENKAKTNDIYNLLIQATSYYMANDKVNCGLKLVEMGDVQSMGETIINLYNTLKTATFEDAYRHYNTVAYTAEKAGNYQDALNTFLICEKFKPANVEVLFHIGFNYTKTNNGVVSDTAKSYFEKVIALEPNSGYASMAKDYLN